MTRKNLFLVLGIIAVIVIGGLATLYGQGQLNLGALGIQPQKVSRVAAVECPGDATKISNSCVYTFEPLEYYVIKDGSNFVIYGPTVTEKFSEKGWSFNDGTQFNGAGYSVAKAGFVPMILTFKNFDRDGEKVPGFSFDYETAKSIQGSRFVEINLPAPTKIRFNMFNIPDPSLVNR